jgi:hypothetical protein
VQRPPLASFILFVLALPILLQPPGRTAATLTSAQPG